MSTILTTKTKLSFFLDELSTWDDNTDLPDRTCAQELPKRHSTQEAHLQGTEHS